MTMREFWAIDYPEKYSNPERYDFTEEDTSDNYKNLNGLERFFAYIIKYKGKTCNYEKVKEKYAQLYNQQVFENLVNPDSKCMLLRKIYTILWDERYLDFRGRFITGNTMNSANTTFNRYVQLSPYNKFKQEKAVLGTISLYYSNNEFKTHLNSNNNLVEFINSYHTLGNFIPFPVGCNSPRRVSSSIRDYWDLTIACVYNYYAENKNKIKRKENELYSLEDFLDGENLIRFKDWLDEFGGWKTFVEDNYMSSFIDKNGKPKELWKGHFDGAVLPETIDQCNEYFKNASEWILKRGELMVEAIRGL